MKKSRTFRPAALQVADNAISAKRACSPTANSATSAPTTPQSPASATRIASLFISRSPSAVFSPASTGREAPTGFLAQVRSASPSAPYVKPQRSSRTSGPCTKRLPERSPSGLSPEAKTPTRRRLSIDKGDNDELMQMGEEKFGKQQARNRRAQLLEAASRQSHVDYIRFFNYTPFPVRCISVIERAESVHTEHEEVSVRVVEEIVLSQHFSGARANYTQKLHSGERLQSLITVQGWHSVEVGWKSMFYSASETDEAQVEESLLFGLSQPRPRELREHEFRLDQYHNPVFATHVQPRSLFSPITHCEQPPFAQSSSLHVVIMNQQHRRNMEDMQHCVVVNHAGPNAARVSCYEWLSTKHDGNLKY